MKNRFKEPITKSLLKDIIYEINGSAIEVHKAFGPGLLESVYHACMKRELSLRYVNFQSELNIDVVYKGLPVEAHLRCDLFVEKLIVVELKAVDFVMPVHEAKLITYMKLLEAPQGLMINFNVGHIFKEGQKSYVNELYRALPDE
jgi:GxxExxY protein